MTSGLDKYATATGLSDLLSGDISHDKITKYLNSVDLDSKELWEYAKSQIRKQENQDGVLILDDSIEEKPYTDENKIVAWYYSYAKGRHVKGINILSCLVSYGDTILPTGYEIISLEIMKVATATNHFAIKYKLLVTANMAAMNELINLRKNFDLA